MKRHYFTDRKEFKKYYRKHGGNPKGVEAAYNRKIDEVCYDLTKTYSFFNKRIISSFSSEKSEEIIIKNLIKTINEEETHAAITHVNPEISGNEEHAALNFMSTFCDLRKDYRCIYYGDEEPFSCDYIKYFYHDKLKERKYSSNKFINFFYKISNKKRDDFLIQHMVKSLNENSLYKSINEITDIDPFSLYPLTGYLSNHGFREQFYNYKRTFNFPKFYNTYIDENKLPNTMVKILNENSISTAVNECKKDVDESSIKKIFSLLSNNGSPIQFINYGDLE